MLSVCIYSVEIIQDKEETSVSKLLTGNISSGTNTNIGGGH